MARQNHCTRLVAFWHNDPRFRLVGKAASYTWLDLVLLMERLGTPEGLRFGPGPGPELGCMDELARLLDVGQTELETHLDLLVWRGLLRREPCGALLLPEALAPSAKARAARINGMKGGRPRKDGSPPTRRSTPAPSAGEQTERSSENPSRARARESDSDDDSDRIKASSSMTRDAREATGRDTVRHDAAGCDSADHDALTREVARLAGVAPTPAATRHVDRWLAQGITPEAVLRTVREVMGRVPAGTVISSLKYFERPMHNALSAVEERPTAAAARTEPEAAWVTAARSAHERDFAAWLARWGNGGMCSDLPEPPTLDAYLIRAQAEAEGAAQASASGTEVAA